MDQNEQQVIDGLFSKLRQVDQQAPQRDAEAEERPSSNRKLSFRYQSLAPGEGKLLGDGGSGDRKALPTSRSDEPEIEVDESEESVDESVN